MSKEEIIKNTIDKLRRLDENKLREANDFVDFLLTKVTDRELTKKIQKQAAEGKTFSFLEDEEELYSTDDLTDRYSE